MAILKWVLDLLLKVIKLPFGDDFKSLLKHNTGQAIEVKISGEWKKAIVVKTGTDYAVLLIEKKEVFLPISAIQALRFCEV